MGNNISTKFSYDLNRAGKVTFNEYSQHIYIERNDMNLGGGKGAINVSAVYDGNGWNLNYYSTLYYFGSDKADLYCLWTMSSGEKMLLTLFVSKRLNTFAYVSEYNYGEEDENYVLDMNTHVITDKDGNEYYFTDNKHLDKYIDGSENKNSIIIHYSNDLRHIDKITDGVGRSYSCVYDGSKLTYFAIKDKDGNIIERGGEKMEYQFVDSCLDNGNFLSTLTYPDGESIEYEYGEHGIVRIKGTNNYEFRNDFDGYMFELSYGICDESGKFNKIDSLKYAQKYSNQNSYQDYTHFIIDSDDNQNIITENDAYILQKTNNKSLEGMIYDEKKNPVKKFSFECDKNLIENGDFSNYSQNSKYSYSIDNWKQDDERFLSVRDAGEVKNFDGSESNNALTIVKREPDIGKTIPEMLNGIKAGRHYSTSISQDININAKANDYYILSFLSYEIFAYDHTSSLETKVNLGNYFDLYIPPVYYSNEIRNDSDNKIWTYNQMLIQIPSDIESTTLTISSNFDGDSVNNSTYCLFDDIELYKVSGIEDITKEESKEDDETANESNIEKSINKNQDNLVTDYTISSDYASSSGNITYSSTGNYPSSFTKDGIQMQYEYNEDNGLVDSSTLASKTDYQYDSMGHMTSVQQNNVSGLSDNNVIKNEYEYNQDRITKIRHNGMEYSFDYDIYGNIINSSINNKNIISYTYLDSNNVSQVTYANGNKRIYEYDSNGNLQGIKYNDDTDYKYVYQYDDENSLNSVINNDDSTKLCYNDTGYVLSDNNSGEELYSVSNAKKAITYNINNQSMTIGNSNNSSNYDYFINNNHYVLNQSKDDLNTVQSNTFADFSDYTSWINTQKASSYDSTAYNKSLHSDAQYDEYGNMSSLNVSSNSDSFYDDTNYEYDEAGQLVSELHSVDSGNGNNSNYRYNYKYDSGGNIISQTKTLFKDDGSERKTNVFNLSYADENNADIPTKYKSRQNIVSDNIGNITSLNGYFNLKWDGQQLLSYDNGSFSGVYSYNDSGLRTKKLYKDEYDNTIEYTYFWNGSKLIGQTVNFVNGYYEEDYIYEYEDEYDSTLDVDNVGYYKGMRQIIEPEIYTIMIVYNPQGSAIGFTLNGQLYYYLKDINGVIRNVVSYASIILQMSYSAYGCMSYDVCNDYLVFFCNPLTYKDYICDIESDFYYLQSRYYCPLICRFLSADSYYDTGNSIIGTNMFAYCNNNPITFADPRGYKTSDTSNVMSTVLKCLSLLIVFNQLYESMAKVFSENSSIIKNMFDMLAKAFQKIPNFAESIYNALCQFSESFSLTSLLSAFIGFVQSIPTLFAENLSLTEVLGFSSGYFPAAIILLIIGIDYDDTLNDSQKEKLRITDAIVSVIMIFASYALSESGHPIIGLVISTIVPFVTDIITRFIITRKNNYVLP